MVVGRSCGLVTGSMALTADGWHMATHVFALSIAGIAYLLAAAGPATIASQFGTWKIEVLGSFSSALLLGVVAIAMVIESVRRLFSPEAIQYTPALIVAIVGLVVNLVSAWVLRDPARRKVRMTAITIIMATAPPMAISHQHPHHDLNLRSAYAQCWRRLHVGARDRRAAAGLWGGWGGWTRSWDRRRGRSRWWSKGLIADSARVLLDREMDAPIVREIRGAIESDARRGDRRPARLARRPREPRGGDHAGRRGAAHARTYRERLAGIASLGPRLRRGQPLPPRQCR
jgi:hypothetical protein